MALSGTNTERPEYQRMVEAAKTGAFECIVVYDMSRGSRDVADWFSFRKLMRLLHISVFSATETLGEIDNPDDFLKELITAGLGQHTVLQTRQKSIAGVAEKAKQGVFLGGSPPLGYDVREGQYIINAHEAEAVQLVFNLYAMGESYNTIIDQLAVKGYVGKYGRPIGKNSLNALLQNERYIGTYFWNTRQVRYMSKWAGGKENPNAVRITGAIPAIIDMDTWERVQLRMKDNKRRAANGAKYKYLLSGLIECAERGGRAQIAKVVPPALTYAAKNTAHALARQRTSTPTSWKQRLSHGCGNISPGATLTQWPRRFTARTKRARA